MSGGDKVLFREHGRFNAKTQRHKENRKTVREIIKEARSEIMLPRWFCKWDKATFFFAA